MNDQEINERLNRLAQNIGRLERKTDFLLRHLNLEYIDHPEDTIPPKFAGVYALLKQGKRLQALLEYRKLTNTNIETATVALDELEMGVLKE